MGGAAYEAAMAEYALIEDRLRDPAVLRHHRLARRLRREAAALEAMTAAEYDTRDRFDPYDVVLRVTAMGEGSDTRFAAAALVRAYVADARRRGWRVEHLTGEPEDGVPQADLAICGGEDGPGPWSVLKGETDVPREAVRVLVVPEPDPLSRPPGADGDWRVDPACTRMPHAPTAVRVTHLPTGLGAWGVSRGSPHRARDNAVRTVRALLFAGGRNDRTQGTKVIRPPVSGHVIMDSSGGDA
ncbi:hypothetical protein [Thermomonospora umbrina]|uniref:Peptide chain release factor 1 n=1 Tax=Thermomonospora umbrina TaxID=111806 RepID=A0A3D9SG57_9ACTN|nr:hypothetical protein [Thermomonospora umbrina]REE94898.1 hypothetical protein DFJ69_0267 [Thermomonospora umbrina]